MADEVVKAPEVTPVEAPKAETEKKPARGGRKKGTVTKAATAKKADAKVTEKKPGRKPATKKVDKKPVEKKVAPAKKTAPAPELNYKSVTIEFNDKKYSQKDLFDRVQTYIRKHPYIVAHDIELFVKPNESCAYFTVDGFSNPDFRIEL